MREELRSLSGAHSARGVQHPDSSQGEVGVSTLGS